MIDLENEEILWKDRKHWMWFPFSFTRYSVTKEHLNQEVGFFKTTYEETLLYRIVDVRLVRSFGQKIFGTGTVQIFNRVDTQKMIELKNIKKPKMVKKLISQLVEQVRNEKKVVGKEFYGMMGGGMPMMPDLDGDGMPDMPDFDEDDGPGDDGPMPMH
ncbi:MAG: PH domain-containing protein [Lachnospiraceae bacterium]|nr:PH domain-containing protein [Lachnospiraceae bacterium]